jgi:polysaccharide biosynthesis protein PslH
LFLTCHLPFPPLSGGRRREYELITRLSQRFEIDICAVTETLEADREHVRAAGEHCRHVSLHAAECSASGTGAPQVERHASASARSALQHLAQRTADYDLVHVEGFYLMQHIPPRCRVPVLLVEQNIEHLLWRQRALVAEDERSCRELDRRAEETYHAERVAWLRASRCATVTEEDRRTLLADMPFADVSVVPDGFDHDCTLQPAPEPPTPPRPAPGRGRRVVMVANYAYQPNVDAAVYLLTQIYPRVLASEPECELELVGAEPPRELTELAGRVGKARVTGRVPAIHPHLESASVVVCPLRIGGGVKVKMLEAIARGCAIVTTSIGAQGLPTPQDGVRIEDTPEGFADAVCELLASATARERLRARAIRLAASLPTWDQAAERLAECYSTLGESAVVQAA